MKPTFGEALRIMMSRRGMRVKQLSQETGIQPTTLYNYTSDQSQPGLYNLLQICRALDCAPQELADFPHEKGKETKDDGEEREAHTAAQ